MVFYSPSADLLPYQGQFPFDVVADPAKILYRMFGVRSSPRALLSFTALGAASKGGKIAGAPKPSGFPKGGPLGLPADFLIGPDGIIVARHYGTHAYDQWTVDEVLAHAGGKSS